MEIEGVKAGFTVARVDENSIGISARSYDEVNVQVIMEEMGGGGHLNSAATQIKDIPIHEVIETLRTLLLREHAEGDERMKIILIEDVKGRGKKTTSSMSQTGMANSYSRLQKPLLLVMKTLNL